MSVALVALTSLNKDAAHDNHRSGVLLSDANSSKIARLRYLLLFEFVADNLHLRDNSMTNA